MGTVGAYELLEELGRGGMGAVFRARHVPTGALRAVKVLAGAPTQEAMARFRREAEVVARIAGGGVPVHEIGVEHGRPFLVMALMTGGSLRARLRARQRFAWEEAARLVAQVARGLEPFHRARVVHRDLKPDNILFDEEDRPWIADFGLVRDLGAASLTETGAAVGTVAYMAPEQLDAKPADARADVFALGVLLHELVTGAQPFAGSPYKQLADRLARRRARASELAGAPLALDALLDRALAPAPAERFASAGELAAALDALVAKGAKAEKAPARRKRGALLAAAAVAALVALTAALVAGSDRSRPDTGAAREPQPPPAPRRSMPAPASRSRAAEARDAFDRAFQKHRRGERDALADADLAVALAPANAEAWALRAAIRLAANEPHGAIADVTSALAIERRLEWVQLKIEAEIVAGDRAAVSRDIDDAVKADPSEATVRWAQPLKDRMHALEWSPTPHPNIATFNEVGQLAAAAGVKVAQGDIAGARTAANRALALDENNTWAWYAHAQVLRAEMRPDAALAAFERATLLEPTNAGAWSSRATIHRERGELDAARDEAERAVAAAPTEAWVYVGLADVHEARQEIDAARAALDRAAALAAPEKKAEILDARAALERRVAEHDRKGR